MISPWRHRHKAINTLGVLLIVGSIGCKHNASGNQSSEVLADFSSTRGPFNTADWPHPGAVLIDAPRINPIDQIYALYRPTVNSKKNNLAVLDIVTRLGIDTTHLEENVPVENLLSSYAKTWAYHDSGKNGPNCRHTAIASIFPNWTVHRYMAALEADCHQAKSFRRLTKNDQLQFGDLIVLGEGQAVEHVFTYLGPDASDPRRVITFTKNAWARSEFVFMDFETVATKIFHDPEVTWYHPIRNAVDPANFSANSQSGAPVDCKAEYDIDLGMK